MRSAWQAFRSRFIRDDGRVVDVANAGASHTEGQGWGLLFAVYFDDMAVFNRILAWTMRSLRRPHDSLHVWRYRPQDAHPISDMNNATDGDLFIAWALAGAAQRWGVREHARLAAEIAQDVLRLLTRRVMGKLLLLPGADGFETARTIVINPSYYVFPAFPILDKLAPSPVWAELQENGLALIDRGRFGPWKLPPDWLQVTRDDGHLAPSPLWPPRCSYDAIRIPLYLTWAGHTAPVIEAFTSFYAPQGPQVARAWVNLETDAEADYPAPTGMLAVAQMAAAAHTHSTDAITFPSVADAPDYYSAALILLARIAWQERPVT